MITDAKKAPKPRASGPSNAARQLAGAKPAGAAVPTTAEMLTQARTEFFREAAKLLRELNAVAPTIAAEIMRGIEEEKRTTRRP